MRKLRGALLGAGNIALLAHAPMWAADELLRGSVELVAVADLSAQNRRGARQVFPRARLYEDAEEALATEELDFCDICTPPFTHRTLVESAAARGLAVVCEKPMAPTLDDAVAMARAVQKAQVVFQPCHQYHYSPQWRTVRELLPAIGRIHLAEYRVQRLAANPGSPHWRPQWRTEAGLAGGGILVDHGAHIFYQLRGLLGEPLRVQATTATLRHHDYGVEDTAMVTLDYGGCLAEVSLTWAGHRREISYRFVGERGEIHGDEERVRLYADHAREVRPAAGMSEGSSHAGWYAPLLRDFTRRVRSGDRSGDGLVEAIHVTRLIARAYESAAAGRALPLQEPGDAGSPSARRMTDAPPTSTNAGCC